MKYGLLIACLIAGLTSTAQEPARRLCAWAVLGPFAADSDGARLEGAALRPVIGTEACGKTWRYFDDRLYCRNYDDYVDLYTCFMDAREGGPGGGTDHKLAWCGGYVWSPVARVVSLRFSANDTACVWLNGALVLNQSDVRQAIRDESATSVSLEAGWNPVIVRVANDRRNWGFYFNLTGTDGKRLDGLEYAADDPAVAPGLEVLNPALPTGYNKQPYVWLDVRNPGGKFPGENPSASPLRLMARGGNPPYAWEIDGLPEGLSLDSAEGELRGRTESVGKHGLTITVSDAADPPNRASREFTLEIKPRATELWWETGSRLGSLRHHGGSDATHWAVENADQQVDFLKRQGYDWQAYTMFSWWSIRPDGSLAINNAPAALAYRDGVRAAGIRFAQYMNFFDFRELSPDAKTHAERMHEALELCMRQNEPALWWFDLSIDGLKQPAEFDALYSLIRTLDPNCLITVNNDIRARDFECGDLDILQVHGSFQSDSYWGHWPPSPLLKNTPKFMPVDAWRLPWKGYMDPMEWCRVLVSMLADPANLEAPRTLDLDTTPILEADYNTVELHRDIAAWLEPRKESILGTMPLAIPPADWGYVVRQPKSGDVYLHILSNPLGKRGVFERLLLDVELGLAVKSVELFPDGEAVPFTESDGQLTVDVRKLRLDPADTILRVVTGP